MTDSRIETTVLDNGLTVVTERMEHVRSVAIGFWAGVGSRDESDEQMGASHFLEHLLFKGSATRSAASIAEIVDEAGGDLNAFTTKEYTAFEVRLLDDALEVGLDVLSDIFWSPAFRPEEVETEREVILEEILSALDEPADLAHDVLVEAMFPDDPLGRSILGSEEAVESMTRDTIAAFHAAHYVPGHVVVAAAGALDHDVIVDGIAAHAPVASTAPAPIERRPPSVATGGSRLEDRDIEQVHIAVGVPGVDRTDDARFAVDLLVQVLGGGLSSRLFQEVRERRGLAYDVYASRAAYQGAGVVSLYAATAPRNAEAVLDVFVGALQELAREGITGRELEVAQRSIRASMLLGLEDSGARMGRLARSQLVLGRVPAIEDALRRYASVTVEEVGDVASRLLDAPPSVALVGPTS